MLYNRQNLDRILTAKDKANGTIVTPSYLRFEKSIEGSFTTISFDVLANQGTPTVTERRLALTDKFVVTSLGFWLLKSDATAASVPVSTSAQIANAVPYSYPNSTAFSLSGQAANLQSLYNSYMSLRINTTVYIDSLPMMNFQRIATSQQVTAAANQNGISRDEWQSAGFGTVAIEPTVTFNGAAKIDLAINMPTSVALGGSGSHAYQTTACVIAYGYLKANASQLNNR